jgi:hypothetical protein
MPESNQSPKSDVREPKDDEERQQLAALVTSRPWYPAEIGPRLRPSVRGFYKNYVKLGGKELVDHLYSIVSLHNALIDTCIDHSQA